MCYKLFWATILSSLVASNSMLCKIQNWLTSITDPVAVELSCSVYTCSTDGSDAFTFVVVEEDVQTPILINDHQTFQLEDDRLIVYSYPALIVFQIELKCTGRMYISHFFVHATMHIYARLILQMHHIHLHKMSISVARNTG